MSLVVLDLVLCNRKNPSFLFGQGQRWSAKYRHDKDWLQKGHMYGLSFLTENYSHRNAKKIISTHQLLADVYSVKSVLHGLQLKMDILQAASPLPELTTTMPQQTKKKKENATSQPPPKGYSQHNRKKHLMPEHREQYPCDCENKHNPSLQLWARSWVNSDEDQPMGGIPDSLHFRGHLNQNSNPETYITSEHSYQKPPGTAAEHTRDVQGTPAASIKEEEEEEVNGAIALSGCVTECSVEQTRNCMQWQMNLLTHIEDVQNQLAARMDLIEKELDGELQENKTSNCTNVLESWLDFTGELEPPEPLARLPQLKCHIKQLLTDLAKVQQMSTLCSV
ncbi:hypothetical protein DNTS_017011 [Danionella cerebrum]|uniref:Uncharacterized protein n=1 Tax=Danionella cerebrum TaxID=2873325 RepID=A0A553NNB3_9TELE|nr:hypothetical protein DNTS_017011 [Danionella translucida]